MKLTAENLLRFGRYVMAGAISFVCEYLTFLALYYGARLHVVIANTLTFLVALAVSFALNRRWVFKSHSADSRRQFMLFTTLALVNLAITNTLLVILKGAGVEPGLAKLGVMVLILMWNFAIMRAVVFKETPPAV